MELVPVKDCSMLETYVMAPLTSGDGIIVSRWWSVTIVDDLRIRNMFTDYGPHKKADSHIERWREL